MRYLNLVLFTGMLVMNYLANALPFNNKTTGQISDSYPNLFVPAGITFSIWGIIYLLLAAYCIRQFTGSQSIIQKTAGMFAITCLLNSLWILAWHYMKVPVSLLIMAGLLVSLIYINMTIRELPYGLIKAAFGVYLGWITIATIANATALLVQFNWNGWGLSEQMWTIIMILSGALVASLALFRLNNPYIGISVAWAFTGIILKQQSDYITISIASALAITIVGIVTIIVFFRKFSGVL